MDVELFRRKMHLQQFLARFFIFLGTVAFSNIFFVVNVPRTAIPASLTADRGGISG